MAVCSTQRQDPPVPYNPVAPGSSVRQLTGSFSTLPTCQLPDGPSWVPSFLRYPNMGTLAEISCCLPSVPLCPPRGTMMLPGQRKARNPVQVKTPRPPLLPTSGTRGDEYGRGSSRAGNTDENCCDITVGEKERNSSSVVKTTHTHRTSVSGACRWTRVCVNGFLLPRLFPQPHSQVGL